MDTRLKSAYEKGSTVICILCMFEHIFYEPFSLKIADLEDILCQLVEFCVLSEFHSSKTRLKQINENLRLNVYTACSGNLYKISYP